MTFQSPCGFPRIQETTIPEEISNEVLCLSGTLGRFHFALSLWVHIPKVLFTAPQQELSGFPSVISVYIAESNQQQNSMKEKAYKIQCQKVTSS